jgi:hypothetical protein
MSADRELQAAAKAMALAAIERCSVLAVMKKLCPRVCQQIRRDRTYPGLLSLWGRSVNVDENANQIIVHPAILHAIGQLAGVRMQGQIVHAGLQHTYGYLFSLIQTPYGKKRDRWLSTTWERGFGLDLLLLSDRPREGSLLANLTWFLGQIVYRDQPRGLRRLQRSAAAVAKELVDFDFAHLSVCRIAERVTLPGKTKREVALITDLLAFPHQDEAEGQSNLLIYSVETSGSNPRKLITAFPVSTTVVDDMKASVSRRKVEVRLRFNGYVPGLYGKTLLGRRVFLKSHQN